MKILIKKYNLKIKLRSLVLLLVLVGGTSVTAINYEKIFLPIKYVSSIRRKVYKDIKVAASSDLLLDDNKLTLNEMRFLQKNNLKGVWCGGAAHYLQKIYKKMGYKSWIYNFGVPEYQNNKLLTHMVTLVEVNGKIYIQDPYFNASYKDDFFTVIEQIANNKQPIIYQDRDIRNILFQSKSTNPLVVNRNSFQFNEAKNCMKANKINYKCNVVHTVKKFEDSHKLVPSTLAFLENSGHLSSLSSLMLYPLNYPNNEEFVQKIKPFVETDIKFRKN